MIPGDMTWWLILGWGMALLPKTGAASAGLGAGNASGELKNDIAVIPLTARLCKSETWAKCFHRRRWLSLALHGDASPCTLQGTQCPRVRPALSPAPWLFPGHCPF